MRDFTETPLYHELRAAGVPQGFLDEIAARNRRMTDAEREQVVDRFFEDLPKAFPTPSTLKDTCTLMRKRFTGGNKKSRDASVTSSMDS